MQIYLAARYGRRLELCDYRRQLNEMGHNVQSRWLDGGHQVSDTGTPIGEHGESLVEGDDDSTNVRCAELRGKFARDDVDDVMAARCIVSFTEPPRSNASRGGRHVEFGMALMRQCRVVVIGCRENIFHWLPCVEFYAEWTDFIAALNLEQEYPADERWLPIPGYESLYDASDCGRIRAVNPSARFPANHILSSFSNGSDYRMVTLCKDGKSRNVRVHRMVLLAFVGERPGSKYECNHKNGIKTDNRISNLEWVTRLENIRHSFALGLR